MTGRRIKSGPWQGEFAAEFADSPLLRLFDGGGFPAPGFPGRVEEFHRNVGVTWRMTMGAEERIFFAKSFTHGFADGLINLFTPLGAARSWKAAQIMAEAGLATPRPVGYMERRALGLLRGSVFISEAVRGALGRNLEAYFRENFDQPKLSSDKVKEKREIISLLADLFQKAHGQDRIYFPDFHPHNLLLARDGGRLALYMVDFDEVNFRVRRDDRLKNLASLGRNAVKIEKKMKHKTLTSLDRLRFLRDYLGQPDSAALQKLWRDVRENWELK